MTVVNSPLHPKISTNHLQRSAIVYVRQSTMKQVELNRESQLNQYRLVDRAHQLGWPTDRVRVIDSDLGQSGQSSQHRNGFNDMMTSVALGHIGIVLSYEVSRLARNNSDWYRLLDLAAVFGTLIADVDGVYDPRAYNDRLLLGLKGTMSEAELHVIRSRMDAGRLSQVRRAEYIQNLPTGLIRQPDGKVAKDPDEQIQKSLELVFVKFIELGSCGKVVRYCRDHQILLPRRQVAGLFAGELHWKPASDSMLLEILKNPAYAGAFVYGRKQGDLSKMKPGRRATGRVRFPMEEWIHLQQGVYPAYITWEQYLLNQERLRQNGLRYQEQKEAAMGASREGRALLQGLVVCSRCGHHMHVVYKDSQRYACDAQSRHVGGKICMSLDGVAVDEAVTQVFFEAIQPSQLDALEAVLVAQQNERDKLDENWRQKLTRAQYEARLAERQYKAVDPDNRLVAANLEHQWEDKLKARRVIQEDYERFQSAPLKQQITPEMHEQFRHISDALPSLWASGRVTNAQKKELLRSLIKTVILNRVAADKVEIRIVWISGHCTIMHARPRRIHRSADVSNYEQLRDRIHELVGQGFDDDQMADQLTREGFCSARAGAVSACSVRKIRLKYDWYLLNHVKRRIDKIDGKWTVAGLAKQVGVSTNYIQYRIYDKTIDPAHVQRDPKAWVYLIEDYPGLCDTIRARYNRFGKSKDRRRHSHE